MDGKILDWSEALVEKIDDPESRPAGVAEPHYTVSENVKISRDNGIYVYHLPDDQLGQGSSFGNSRIWAETKGNGDMLNLYSIEAGNRLIGGMSITYLLPFNDLSVYGQHELAKGENKTLNRAMPSAVGAIHLHPAYQQRELVVGDGLHILETFFVPRTDGMDDPAAALEVVSLWNRTMHPIEIIVVASLSFRGHTPADMHAEFDKSRNAILAWNESSQDMVRIFGSTDNPRHYWATNDKDAAYNPKHPLPDKTSDIGDLVGTLQFNVILYPGAHQKVRVIAAFSHDGKKKAMADYDRAKGKEDTLKRTITYYNSQLTRSIIEMPDDMLTHGIQWAKSCLIRPVCRYKIGIAATNDPGNSNHIVGRDTCWYVHGCDFIKPEWSCSMLSILCQFQRKDGLIPEYIDGNTGMIEDFAFNINDATPLYIMAVEHHIKCTAHWQCLEKLYESVKKAGELILSQMNEDGLVKCNATGLGPQAICSWRNVLHNQSISGIVTEVNSECFAALRALSNLAKMANKDDDAIRYKEEADALRTRINKLLVNPRNGLYVLNISPEGNVYTQATCDLVFPLICGVANENTADNVTVRLAESDFMTDAGIRVLPSDDPEYDPSFESGCMGGVWQGVTWWYAMATAGSDPEIMANSLSKAYSHYVLDPKVYNTVPGQFSEWSDGQTLVNRGMRLSPWDSPRFLWAAIEGLVGLKFRTNGIDLQPNIPLDWQWLRVHNVKYRDGNISLFLARHSSGIHVFSPNSFDGDFELHTYDEELEHSPEAITTGITSSAFRKGKEVLLCFGSNLNMPAMGPFLAHHSLSSEKQYRVRTLASHYREWQDLGKKKGSDLQRLAVRIGKQAYAIYHFEEV